MRLWGLQLAVASSLGCAGGVGTAAPPPGVSQATPPDRSPPRDDPEEEAPPRESARGAPEPRVVLEPDGGEPVTVRVEIARTPSERERGLMYRRHLAEDAGMLFLFDRMEHQSFWMENTLIPLDIIFVDDRLEVVGVVRNAQPRTRDDRSVEGESQYVLEVNAGFARRNGVGPGTRVRFEGVPGIGDSEETR